MKVMQSKLDILIIGMYSPELFVLVLPEGVCGNTVNRFITHIQHYLEPDFSVYIGDEEYESFIEKSI